MGVTRAMVNRADPQADPGRPADAQAIDRCDDGELARRTAAGDHAAATALIERYQSMVRSFLCRLTRRADVADDLAQETFVRMLRHAASYDPRYPMRTWLLTIARRLSINHGRKADHNVAATEYLGMQDHDQDGPAEQAARADDTRALRAVLDEALGRLSEPQRAALVMFHQQQMSVEEVAEAMKMPLGTIKSHLHRGRAALRGILGPQFGTTEP